MNHILSSRSAGSRFRKLMIVLPALLAFPSLFAGAQSGNYQYTDKEYTQQDTMGFGSNNMWEGARDSRQEGTHNAYRAINAAHHFRIGAAIRYAYRGYGNYINSQKMDELDVKSNTLKNRVDSDANQKLLAGKAKATSAGASGASGITGGSGTSQEAQPRSRKMSDMDKGFLYKGEIAEAAAEFEKASGMPREELFDQIASIADSQLSWDDPELMNKIEERYQTFIAAIPNKDFKASMERAHSAFDLVKRTELIQEAQNFYRENRYGGQPPTMLAKDDAPSTAGSVVAATPPAQATRAPASEAAPVLAKAETPAAAVAEKDPSKEAMLGLDDSPHSDELKDLLNSSAGEDTIFILVSRRYRELAPSLLKRAEVLEVK